LPTWDATLLVHARRTLLLPEEYRSRIFNTKNPQSFATFLVDGSVAGVWSWERSREKARLGVEPFERPRHGPAAEVREEAARLIRLVEPDAASYKVRIQPSEISSTS